MCELIFLKVICMEVLKQNYENWNIYLLFFSQTNFNCFPALHHDIWAPRSLDTVATQGIRPKLILNSNIPKYHLPITYYSVTKSICYFAQITAVLLPHPVKNCKTIWRPKSDILGERDCERFDFQTDILHLNSPRESGPAHDHSFGALKDNSHIWRLHYICLSLAQLWH